jgi:mannitol/fructose-specific phosphotransferase system IIA component (Ntr-type)
LKADTKDGVIEEMIGMLDRSGRLPDRAAALSAVMEREQKMSTGMQFGIAIPHGKTDTVPALATAVALKPEGIDFSSLDGEPSRIFVMTVSPVSDTGPHVQYLSEISKLLNQPPLREELLACTTEEEMKAVLLQTTS